MVNLSALLRVYPSVKLLTAATAATAATALMAIVALTGCKGVNPAAEPSASAPTSPAVSPSRAATPSPAVVRTPSGSALTGFGATSIQWKAAHTLDVSVPARVAGSADGEDTWQLVTMAGGRITSYKLNVAPSSLSSAEARARQELPADARLLWTRTVADTCAQEQFESAALAAVLGDGQVNVEFDNAVSGNATPVTEELFSTDNAPTVAQAPAC